MIQNITLFRLIAEGGLGLLAAWVLVSVIDLCLRLGERRKN